MKSSIIVDTKTGRTIIHSHPKSWNPKEEGFEDRFGADLGNLKELDGMGSLVIEPDGKVIALKMPKAVTAAIEITQVPTLKLFTYLLSVERGVLREAVEVRPLEEAKPSLVRIEEAVSDMIRETKGAEPFVTGISPPSTAVLTGALVVPTKAAKITEAEQAMGWSAEELVKALARRDRKYLEGALRIASRQGVSELQIAEGLAIQLQRAGMYQNNLGVMIDTRKGAYNAAEIIEAIRSVSRDKTSPVKYIVIVDKDSKLEVAHPNIHLIAASDGEDVLAKAKGMMDALKIDKICNIAVALTEDNVSIIEDHYGSKEAETNPESRFNFLIAKKGVIESKEAPLKTLIAELVKLASQNDAVALAVECAEETIVKIKNAAKFINGILRLIRIRAFEINRVFSEFITALTETARSL